MSSSLVALASQAGADPEIFEGGEGGPESTFCKNEGESIQKMYCSTKHLLMHTQTALYNN